MKIHILGSGAYPLRFQDGRSLSLLLPEHGIIVDAGLGLTALPHNYKTETLHILLSHFHHDHILGLAFLANFLERGQCRSIVIHGDERIEKLISFFQEPFNPEYTSKNMPITMEYFPKTTELAGVAIHRKKVPHSSGTSNYFTFASQGKSFGFGTDTTASTQNAEFFRNIKTLFHECNYDNSHKDQAIKEGHSYPEAVGKLALAAGVDQLFLIHTDPRYPKVRKEIQTVFPKSDITTDDQIIEV